MNNDNKDTTQKENYLNRLIKKISENKKYTNLVMVISIGIMILLAITVFFDEGDEVINNANKDNDDIQEEVRNNMNNYSNELEIKLENILSQMKGVGEVDVMITLVETVESIPAINKTNNKEITTENDAQGGNRNVTREESTEQVVVSGSENSMMTIKEIKPEIKGVIVSAQGASDIRIKETIYGAVKTVLGLSGNKVSIHVKK
ncbi:hypothetical protein GOQ27_16050 [Clostridium sp. D2Q-11]|uniref:Stage III sporulation protein AG n=1 Tax=Anaeromonas frigoriresistens TaxID=2683708 RepID=A0A942ZAP9_9FIRM|nr:hypothetical protein [Anaeromonas frigoriresistens]MBS4539990.1 hypothetical protein [Anaeromonas frigoriresistens]